MLIILKKPLKLSSKSTPVLEPKLKDLFEYIKTGNNKMVEKVLAANPIIDINQMRLKEAD